MSVLNMLLATGGMKSLKNGFSGSSLIDNRYGLETSGLNYRQIYDDTAEGGYLYAGAWGTVNSQGIFFGDSSESAYGAGIHVSGNLIQATFMGQTPSGWVAFDLDTHSFSGVSAAYKNTYNFNTSGGLLCISANTFSTFWVYSPYISLT